jgi:hypothetical protein
MASSTFKSFVGGPACRARSTNLVDGKTVSGISRAICKRPRELVNNNDREPGF